MVIDQYREGTCPNCGEGHTIDTCTMETFKCVCGVYLQPEEDEIDGSLHMMLEVVSEEKVYKWKLPVNEEPFYLVESISFNNDNQK